MNRSEIEIIDEFLTHNYVESNYYINLCKKYPDDEYINSMFTSWKIDNTSIKDAQSYWLNVSKRLEKGTYYYWVEGQLQYSVENFDEAELLFLRSKSLDINCKNKWLRLTLYNFYFAQNQEERADIYLDEALRIDNTFYDAVIAKYYSLINHGEILAAKDVLVSYMQQRGDDVLMTNLLGYLLIDLGNIDEAKSMFERSNGVLINADALAGIAKIHFLLNEDSIGIETIEKALAVNKNSAIAAEIYRDFLVESENLIQAENYAKLTWEIKPSYQNCLDYINIEVLLQKYLEATRLVLETESMYGKGYELDYWKIIISSFQDDGKTQELINLYFQAYSHEEIQFLKDNLQYWNIYLEK